MKVIIFLICLTSFGFFVSPIETAEIHIKKGSEVIIEGKSNVNTFSCEYTSSITQGYNTVNYNVFDETYVFENASIILQSKEFDCGGRLINKDFNDLVQSDAHPAIKIKLQHIKARKGIFSVKTNIEIAGKNNPYTFEMCHNKDDNYSGELTLNIEDFDLKAPKKLLGTIKVAPEINIYFNLDLLIKE